MSAGADARAACPPAATVIPLDPTRYAVHALHRDGCAWIEKNCYTDVWIEALHALGVEPLAMLPFTLGLDFEGDQWTFFKPPHTDLAALYGIAVHELNLWRGNLLEHAATQVAAGRLVVAEVDAYWLPDTAGTDYRQQHTKSTIVVNALDTAARRLGYFHNAGYYELQGEDFVHLFRLGYPHDPAYMPFFAEFVRLDRLQHRPVAAMVAASTALLRDHLACLPVDNPVARFAQRFPGDVAWLQSEGLPLYHGYAFATLRQLGANFELTARYLAWLGRHGESGLDAAQAAFEDLSTGAKALVLKTARAVQGRRSVDFGELLGGMANAWSAGTTALRERYR